jgi:radical SAM protein with 4Fe4S-binding SPASM domain
MIAFTASRANYSEFPRVAELGRRLGVNRVWADRMVPCGGAAALRDEVLTPEETRCFIGVMRDAQRRYESRRTEIALHRALQFTLGGGTPYRCSAGESLITIMPDGDVYPCRRIPRCVGNVQSTSLTEIYSSSPLLVALRDRQRAIPGCEACFYADVCGGGLRCLAAAVHGDPFRADPGCWLSRAANGLHDAVGRRVDGDMITVQSNVLVEEVAWKS